jgi:outer membrane protein assembly factor BamB
MPFMRSRPGIASVALALLAASGGAAAYSFDEIGRGNIGLRDIGLSRLVMADIDGDGRDDLVFAASAVNPPLVVYGRLDDGTQGVKQLMPASWQGAVSRVLGWRHDGVQHVVLLQDVGTLHDFSGWPLREIRSFPIVANAAHATIGDVDADGTDDLVVLTDTDVLAYSMSDGHLEHEWPVTFSLGGAGADVALAPLDADPALEIIVAGSVYGNGFVLDGATGAIDWQYEEGFGNHVAAGHLAGDATTQWIGDAWQAFHVFGEGPYGLLWSATTPEDIGALATADLDGQGRDSILVGDGQWGALHVFDAATHLERFAIAHDADGILSAVAGDLEGDGVPEIAFAGVRPSHGETLLTIADSTSGATVEKYVPAGGPMTIAAIGDIDGDGRDEVVAVETPYDTWSTVAVFDLETGAETWRSVPFPGNVYDPFSIQPAAIRLVPHPGRPGLDIVMAGSNFYDGRIEVIDGTTMEEVFSVYGYGTGPLGSLEVRDLSLYDVDGDGIEDFIVVTNGEFVESPGLQVLAFSGADGSELWTSPSVGDSTTRARRVFVAPSASGGADIVAVANDRLYAFDAATGSPTWTLAASADGGAFIPDGAVGAELMVYSVSGAITFYDATTHAYLRAFPLPAPVCDVIALDGDARKLLVAQGDALAQLDGIAGTDRATTGQLGQCIPDGTRLAAHAEDATTYAVAIGTGSALFRERLAFSDAIFASSFEAQ